MQPLRACQKDWNSRTGRVSSVRTRSSRRSRSATPRGKCGISQRVTHTPPRDPAISLLGSHPGGIKACAYEKSCTGMFIAALFTTAENSSNKNGCQQANVANPYNRIKGVNYTAPGTWSHLHKTDWQGQKTGQYCLERRKLWAGGNACSLGRGAGFRGVHIRQNRPNCTLYMCAIYSVPITPQECCV